MQLKKSLRAFGGTLIGTIGWVSCASAQFSDQDFFRDMLNQALPRVTPTTQNGFPTNSNNTGFAPTSTSSVPTNWSSGQVAGRPRDWSLGVALDNSDIGALIRQVQPSSPAERAGIEPGDLIVTIGGAQVGLVDGRLNDVGDQIRRSADANGRVRALVLNSRTSRLQVIEINLDSTSSTTTGIVQLRDRQSLPVGSLLTVKLENATRPFYEVNGGTVMVQVSGPGPFSFQMHVDPRTIDPRDQYRFTATINDARGQMLYGMRQPQSVSPSNMASNFRLELESLRDLQMGSSGNVITAAYPADPNSTIRQIYTELLGREPSAREYAAWSQYLSQGHSSNDLKAKILGSPNFYDRVQNNPQLFIQSMFQLLKKTQPSSQEMTAWLGRLSQYQGDREAVVREFLLQLR